MKGELTLGISYFGKLPSRADFLKTPANDHQLIARLDRWAGGALEQLAKEVTWKDSYDEATPINFALMGSRVRSAIAGHLLPSHDETGRRFPFISAVSLEIPKPLSFMSRSPLAFSRVWARLQRGAKAAHAAEDPHEVLHPLVEERANVNVLYESLNPAFQDFLEVQTIGSIEKLLSADGKQVSVRRIMLALGLLLQPVMGAGSAGIGKGLVLPVPADPMYQNLVSCFWFDLITDFLGRANFEVLLLQRQGVSAVLAIGFKGMASGSLCDLFDDKYMDAGCVRLFDPNWVDAQISEDPGLNKLASRTQQKELPLRTARELFRETFLGA